MIIDFHAHIHPGADHGCRDIGTARGQLELGRESGVGAVVTVSHYYPMRDHIDGYLARRERGREALCRLTKQDGTLPRVFFGTEVTLCHGLEKMPRMGSLTVEGTNLLLVEMPYGRWDTSLLDTLDLIRAERGLIPLLAHVDRYNADETEALLADGYMGQLNLEKIVIEHIGINFRIAFAKFKNVFCLGIPRKNCAAGRVRLRQDGITVCIHLLTTFFRKEDNKVARFFQVIAALGYASGFIGHLYTTIRTFALCTMARIPQIAVAVKFDAIGIAIRAMAHVYTIAATGADALFIVSFWMLIKYVMREIIAFAALAHLIGQLYR